MKHFWTKFACLLTGYSYPLMAQASEASRKTLKKFVSALIPVSLIWGFVAYTFSQRYLHTGRFASAVVAAVMVFLVIHIERQIILSRGKNWLVPVFRFLLGFVMAVIGSVIIDQIIFREDVEKQRISQVQEEVNAVLPAKTRDLDRQILELDSAILKKEEERQAVINELTRRPFVKSASYTARHLPMQVADSKGVNRDTVVRRTDYTLTDVPNPKSSLLPGIESQIQALREQKAARESSLINIRQELEEELRSKTGFLDELEVLFGILLSSWVALAVWILFILFFLFIELLVLVIKFLEGENDYDKLIAYEMDMKIQRLNQLKEKAFQVK